MSTEGSRTNADKLLFRTNLSPDTIEKMKQYRKASHALARMIDGFGGSPELTLAFRKIQEAQFYVNAHLCYVDEVAVLEPLPE